MLIIQAQQTASPNCQVLDQRKTFLKKLMWNVPEEEHLRGNSDLHIHAFPAPHQELTYTKLATDNDGITQVWGTCPTEEEFALLCSFCPWGSPCLFCMSDLQEPPLPNLSSKALHRHNHSKTKKQATLPRSKNCKPSGSERDM